MFIIKMFFRILFSLIIICLGQFKNIQASPTTIEQFRSYISAIQSAAINFTQEANEKTVKGVLIIHKPHRFRLNYYPPYPLLIVGNKNYISLYDYDLKQISKIKSQDNLLNFLLLDHNSSIDDFKKNFSVELVSKNLKYISFKIEHHLSTKVAIITFNLDRKMISQMIITDGDDNIVINFDKFEVINSVNTELFSIKNPDIFGTPKWLDQKTIQNNYQVVNQ